MLLTAIFMSSYGVQYYFLAIYFQSVYGYSVLQTGLAFLPATLLCTLGIRVAERLLARHGHARRWSPACCWAHSGSACWQRACRWGAASWRCCRPS